eukprot:gb/GEZN01008442.1/.p1 GENE.gb/GEZN01008442.1/~~gb/GEZN01008442.1/.p1  ORF type:complete len:336 (-),score=26.09 gb/GEZN01008442.1/:420-1400(-)
METVRPPPRKRHKKLKKTGVIHSSQFMTGKPISRGEGRLVTAEYHKLNAKMQAVASDHNLKPEQKQNEVTKIKTQVEQLGGHERYQAASAMNTRKFRTSRYVFATLTKLGVRPKKGEAALKTLEIGAINLQLLSCFWLQTRAIDLVSRHPGKIEALDFFHLKPPASEKERYQVVVCFMVLNYVNESSKRGEMLQRCGHCLRTKGFLFVALPQRCLSSKSMSRQKWLSILKSIGMTLVDSRDTPKISFFCFQKSDEHTPSVIRARLSHSAQDASNCDDVTKSVKDGRSSSESDLTHILKDASSASDFDVAILPTNININLNVKHRKR